MMGNPGDRRDDPGSRIEVPPGDYGSRNTQGLVVTDEPPARASSSHPPDHRRVLQVLVDQQVPMSWMSRQGVSCAVPQQRTNVLLRLPYPRASGTDTIWARHRGMVFSRGNCSTNSRNDAATSTSRSVPVVPSGRHSATTAQFAARSRTQPTSSRESLATSSI
jgi:hypothetical protein